LVFLGSPRAMLAEFLSISRCSHDFIYVSVSVLTVVARGPKWGNRILACRHLQRVCKLYSAH